MAWGSPASEGTAVRWMKRPTNRDRERGDGLVEFALIVPVLMVFLLAVFDFGRAAYAYSVVANAAREGARFGAVAPDNTAGIVAVVNGAAVALNLGRLSTSISHPTTTSVRVQVSYVFDLITPLMARVLGRSSLLLRSTATMYTGY